MEVLIRFYRYTRIILSNKIINWFSNLHLSKKELFTCDYVLNFTVKSWIGSPLLSTKAHISSFL
jgi:hypothetical protein